MLDHSWLRKNNGKPFWRLDKISCGSILPFSVEQFAVQIRSEQQDKIGGKAKPTSSIKGNGQRIIVWSLDKTLSERS